MEALYSHSTSSVIQLKLRKGLRVWQRKIWIFTIDEAQKPVWIPWWINHKTQVDLKVIHKNTLLKYNLLTSQKTIISQVSPVFNQEEPR